MNQELILLPMGRAEGKTSHAIAWLLADPTPKNRWSRVLLCSHRSVVENVRNRTGGVHGELHDFNKRVMTVEEWRGISGRRGSMYSATMQVLLDDADEYLRRQIPGITRLTMTAEPWEA